MHWVNLEEESAALILDYVSESGHRRWTKYEPTTPPPSVVEPGTTLLHKDWRRANHKVPGKSFLMLSETSRAPTSLRSAHQLTSSHKVRPTSLRSAHQPPNRSGPPKIVQVRPPKSNPKFGPTICQGDCPLRIRSGHEEQKLLVPSAHGIPGGRHSRKFVGQIAECFQGCGGMVAVAGRS